MRIVGGYQNTKTNNEDIALTPFLFLVWANESICKVYGIGICWLNHALYIGFGFNIPKDYRGFTVIK